MIETKAVEVNNPDSTSGAIQNKNNKADHESTDAKRFDDYFKTCQTVLNGLKVWKSAVEDEAFINALNEMKESENSLTKLSGHMLEAFFESDIEKTLQYFKEIQASSLSSIPNTGGLVRHVFASIFDITNWHNFTTILSSAISEVLESIETDQKLKEKVTSIQHAISKLSQHHIDRSTIFSLLRWTSLIGHEVAYLQVKKCPQAYRIIRCRTQFGGIVEELFTGYHYELTNISYSQLRGKLRTKIKHSYHFRNSNGKNRIIDEFGLVVKGIYDLFDCYLEFFVPFLENNKENEKVLTNTASNSYTLSKSFFQNDPNLHSIYISSAHLFGNDPFTNCLAYAISRMSNREQIGRAHV